MNKILVANWKMNGNIELLKNFSAVMKNPNIVLALPYIFIPFAKQLCETANIAAQNCSEFHSDGAYTGEISSNMLKELGTSYVILGHSERRRLMHESATSINAKIKNALKAELKVIYCISEDFEKQINCDMNGIKDMSNIMIAYEPVSAIGTGETPYPSEVHDIALKIRKILETKVLYGGSVSSKNIMDFCSLDSIDGVLVGGASLKIDEVKSMLLQIQKSI